MPDFRIVHGGYNDQITTPSLLDISYGYYQRTIQIYQQHPYIHRAVMPDSSAS